MSNFILGRIKKIYTDSSDEEFLFSLMSYCKSNGFAIHFRDNSSFDDSVGDIIFQLADNFEVNYCESFLEPIIYTLEGNPLLEKTLDDLNKLYGLIHHILSCCFVEKVELRFSYIEVDEDEYDSYEINLENMRDLILEKYKSSTTIPVIKLIIVK